MLEGFDFIGIEQSEEYVAIAARRIEYWQAVAEQERQRAAPAVTQLTMVAD